MKSEIEAKRHIFYGLINQLRCLKKQVGNALLTPSEKRELYCMTVVWIKHRMKEEEQQAIFKNLPSHEIEQLDDAAIKQLFPVLERVLKEYHIAWYLLGDTQFYLEDIATEFTKILMAAKEDFSAVQTSVQQERESFSTTCLVFIKSSFETMDKANKSFWIRSYIETLERHLHVWQENTLFPSESFQINLTHTNLCGLDLRGIRLFQADLSYSRLARCQLEGTGVSAEQLSTAKEFNQAMGVPADLVLEAQNIRFKKWQVRLNKRCMIFSDLEQSIHKLIASDADNSAQDTDAFSLALEKCKKLTRYKGLLEEHIAAQNIELTLLNDLTTEQQDAIDENLANSKKKEFSFKSKLDSAVNEARWNLCEAYCEKIQNLLAENNLSKALGELEALLILRTQEKDDYPFPKALDETLLGITVQIIEKQIEIDDLDAARSGMKKIIADLSSKKQSLDLRGKSIFENKDFWKGIFIGDLSLYLDSAQVQDLSLSQQQQYNAALFRAIEAGALEQVKDGIENFGWDPELRDEMGHTPIIRACWCGHEAIARHLCLAGAEVLKIERPGESINPLEGLIGVKYREDPARYKPIIEWLIAKGLEIAPKDALLLNDATIFKESLKSVPTGEGRNETMRKLLISAIENGAEALVLWMLENQEKKANLFALNEPKSSFFTLFSDATVQSTQEPSLLDRACKKGQFKIVNLLLQYYLDEVKNGNLSQSALKFTIQTALDYLAKCFWKDCLYLGSDASAVYDNWKCIAELLCTQGAKNTLYTSLAFSVEIEKIAPYIRPETINMPCDAEKNTPLHLAVKADNKRLLLYLIAKGANLDSINSKQDTGLHLACERGNLELVKCLLDAKASPDGPRRPLTADEKEHLTKLAETLAEAAVLLHKNPLYLKKEKKKDGTEKEMPKARPLHVAVLNGHAAVVALLCHYGADLALLYDGKTALHFAVQKEDTASVASLLRYGAKLSALNREGKTALDLAAESANIELMRMLVLAPLREPLSKMQNNEQKKRFFESLGQWALASSEQLEAESGELTPIPTVSTMHSCTSSSMASSTLSTASLTLFSPELIPPLDALFVEEKEEYDKYDIFGAEADDSAYHTPPQPQEPIVDFAFLDKKEEKKESRQFGR